MVGSQASFEWPPYGPGSSYFLIDRPAVPSITIEPTRESVFRERGPEASYTVLMGRGDGYHSIALIGCTWNKQYARTPRELTDRIDHFVETLSSQIPEGATLENLVGKPAESWFEE